MAIHYALSRKMYDDIFIKNACFILGVELRVVITITI